MPHITSRCHVVASEGSGTARSSVVPRRKLSSPIASQPTPRPPESRLPGCRLARGRSLHMMAMVNSAGSSTPSPSAKVWPPQSSQDWTPSSGTVSGAAQRTPESTMSSPSASRASRAKRSRLSVRILSCPTGARCKENSGGEGVPADASRLIWGPSRMARRSRRARALSCLTGCALPCRWRGDLRTASWVTRSSRSSHSTKLS